MHGKNQSASPCCHDELVDLLFLAGYVVKEIDCVRGAWLPLKSNPIDDIPTCVVGKGAND